MLYFDELLEQALFGQNGFYQKEFIDDHFITPSVAAASYAHILGRYIRSQGINSIIEYGAGTGALAQPLCTHVGRYQIIEKSTYCKEIQQRKLEEQGHISWPQHPHFSEKATVILQEIFDCFSQPACFFKDGLAYERCYDHKRAELTTRPARSILEQDLKHYYDFLVRHHAYQPDAIFILPNQSRFFLKQLYDNLCCGSSVIVIDYGESQPQLASRWQAEDIPIRAYKNHQLVVFDPAQIGGCDLTYDVDFYYLMECWIECGGSVGSYQPIGLWLAKQIEHMTPNMKILMDPRLMGERFKLLELRK